MTPDRSVPGPRTRAAWLMLGAILIVATLLRLRGIGFGLPALHDPDELMFELGSVRMLSGPTLNPGWFGHPATTTIYLLAVVNASVFVVGWLLGQFASPEAFAQAIYADPSLVILPGRLLMAAFALGTIALAYRLGSRLFDRATGLLAAALLAVNPVHVTYSQIIRSDMMACFFMLLGLLAALRVLREGGTRAYLLAALWVGLAVATKWPFALTAVPVAIAALLRVRRGEAPAGAELRRLALFGIASVACLLLVSPYLVLDFETVQRNLLGEAQQHHLGATGEGPLQNLWWYLSSPLTEAFGVAGLALASSGAVLLVRRHSAAAALLLPLAIAWLVVISVQTLIFERWALPLVLLLAIIAAPAGMWVLSRLRALFAKRLSVALAAGIAAAVAIPPVLRADADYRERAFDTRSLASAWARKHIPEGSTVLVEHFAFDLLDTSWNLYFPIGDAGCIDTRKLLGGQVKFDRIESMRGARHNVDWGTMPAPLRRDCRFDYAILTQMDRYHRERARFPAEDAAYRDLLSRGEVVATWHPPREKFGLLTTRIVRMRPTADPARPPKTQDAATPAVLSARP